MTQRESVNLVRTTMPGMTIDDAKKWQFQHGEEIRDLAAKGDKLARRVIVQYFVWYDRKNSRDRRIAHDAATEWLKWLNEYIVRDLTIGERDLLRAKYDHHADDDVIKIKNEILHPRDIN